MEDSLPDNYTLGDLNSLICNLDSKDGEKWYPFLERKVYDLIGKSPLRTNDDCRMHLNSYRNHFGMEGYPLF